MDNQSPTPNLPQTQRDAAYWNAALEAAAQALAAEDHHWGPAIAAALRARFIPTEALPLASSPPSLPSSPIHPPCGDVRDDPRYLPAMSVYYSSQHLALVTRHESGYAVFNAARKITGYLPREIGDAIFAAWRPPEPAIVTKSGPPRTKIAVDFEL